MKQGRYENEALKHESCGRTKLTTGGVSSKAEKQGELLGIQSQKQKSIWKR